MGVWQVCLLCEKLIKSMLISFIGRTTLFVLICLTKLGHRIFHKKFGYMKYLLSSGPIIIPRSERTSISKQGDRVGNIELPKLEILVS